MRITFHGAAGEVTGSCYRVETADVCFLVDCGLFQGGREAQRRNEAALDFDLARIDFMLLTHAHLDHSGLLPRAVARGFRGPVHVTGASADLLEIMLLDSAHIQEKEAQWHQRRNEGGNGRNHRQGRNGRRGLAQPLYNVAQAQASLGHLRRHAYDRPFSPHPCVQVCLREAGHILGSAILEVRVEEGRHTRKLVFSGDLGMPARPLLRDPQLIDEADVLLVESTYGNRLHKSLEDTEDELVRAIRDTLTHKKGNIILPAFSVGRTQEVLFVLADLVRRGRLDPLRVVVDSPMSMAATEITLRHLDLLDDEARVLIDWQAAHPAAMQARFVHEVEESVALNRVRSGLVIISASGMCDAGRIKYHLLHNLGRPECAILITGFQAAGTLGRRLVDGARSVTIFGERVPVRARIHTIGGLSAHADQVGLIGWLRHFRRPPEKTFIVHGERETAHIFAEAVRAQLGWPQVIEPAQGDAFELG